MKIHKLKITNIASLKGPHEIDFDSTLLERGSFAITGDTGAGKSTILNCVSLALYGRSYKGLNQGDFITLGQASGKVELTFSCGGNIYLSIWGCRVRKKNGEYLKTPSHTKEFFKLSGETKEVLDLSPEDVIHLNFDQFCKTVILNQGEFAKFLTSTFRERKDILEKLYQGDKLDVFAPLLKERITKYATQSDQAQARINGLGEHIQEEFCLSGLKTLEQKTKEDQDRCLAIKLRADYLKDLCDNDKALDSTRSRIEEISKKIESHIEALNTFQKEKSAFDQQREKFVQSQKERSPALHQALEWEKSVLKITKDCASLNSSINLKSELVERTKQALNKHQDTMKILTTRKKELEDSGSFIKLTDDQIEWAANEYDALNEAHNKLKHLQEFGEHISHSLKSNENKFVTATKELDQAQSKLKTLNALELDKQLRSAEEKVMTLQALSIGLANYKADVSSSSMELKDLNAKLEYTRTRLGQVQARFDKEKAAIDSQKEFIKGAQKAHAKLLCLQESLDINQCVICESSDIQHVHSKARELKDTDFSKGQELVEALEKENEHTFQELQRERSTHSATLAQLEQLREKQKNALSNFLANHLKALSLLGQNGPRPVIEEIETTLIEKEKVLEKLKQDYKEKIQDQTELKGKSRHLEGLIADLDNERKKLRPQYEQTQKSYKDLNREYNQRLQSLQKLFEKTDIKEIKSSLQTAKEARVLENKVKIEQKEGELAGERLNHAHKDLQEASLALASGKEEISRLQEKVSATCGDQSPEEAIKKLEKEAHVLELKRKSMERDLKDLEIEKSALFSRRQTFEEQRRDQENMALKLWGEKSVELNGDFFLSEELIGILRGFNRAQGAPTGEELELARGLSEKDHLEAKEELETAKNELSEYRAILKRQETAKEQIKQLTKELKALESQKVAWEELHLLIGKDEFRNYVLAMVEKLLIQQTNSELSKLCDGRYLIQHKASSSRLAPDFYIIDKFRGDETRKVSTLSGGETFMVSLAMALALAELTRGNADIDSFFIDEGFGTLDRDSLEEALEMLQDIETRGKQIGLISHVKDLTNRIPVNIHLQKNRLGNSSIDIVYN